MAAAVVMMKHLDRAIALKALLVVWPVGSIARSRGFSWHNREPRAVVIPVQVRASIWTQALAPIVFD